MFIALFTVVECCVNVYFFAMLLYVKKGPYGPELIWHLIS